MLLSAKADPNLKSGSAGTPLAEAIYNDQIENVKMLLAAGADTQKAGPNDTSALDYAKLQYRTDIIALLESKAPGAAEKGAAGSAQAAVGNDVGSNIECTIVDAARMQMILHGSLEDQVALGNMDSEIFRTFGDDTKDYGQMLTDAKYSEACRLFERLAVKYGVESPFAKLKATQ